MGNMGKVILIVFIFIVFLIVYTYIDDNRIRVVKQRVTIDNLPDSFNGFTILQISDLHGKEFGKEEKNLIDKINSCKYDMIAITGDVAGNTNYNMKAFYELLNGIKSKDYLFCINGNGDPLYLTGNKKVTTLQGIESEKRGCNLLASPCPIKRGSDTIWVFSLFYNNRLNSYLPNVKDADVKIALSHYPLDSVNYTKASLIGLPKSDLVLAGHYHGGQWRIPFIGAVYVPNVNHFELFPKQNTVSGLSEYGSFKQYISRGLGASSSIPFFRFRLFNTPEINLITLVKRK